MGESVLVTSVAFERDYAAGVTFWGLVRPLWLRFRLRGRGHEARIAPTLIVVLAGKFAKPVAGMKTFSVRVVLRIFVARGD